MNDTATMKTPQLWAVEDDPGMQKTLDDIFSRLGCAVTTFSSAEEALESLEKGFRPDILILDFRLPGMSGPELFRILCLDNRWRNIPVTPFTSQLDDEEEYSPCASEWAALASQLSPSRGTWFVPCVRKIQGDEFNIPERLILSVGNILKTIPVGLPKPFEEYILKLVSSAMEGMNSRDQ